jgi:endonuclease YncB( thermonuclease family)
VSNLVKLSARRRRPAAASRPRRKIGRDFFAVLVVGLCLGVGLAWAGIDTPKVLAFVERASAEMQALASRLSPEESDEEFLVSSIGKKPTAEAVGSKQRTSGGHYPVCGIEVATRRNCVIDGDTFYFRGTTIRISDIDAPETHPPRCAYEADLGDRATRRLSQLLSAGAFQLVRTDRDVDKYGRRLRVVIRNGHSIGKTLVAEGLARTWSGKRRPWCPSGPSS